jgi:hypothetical protein
MLTPVEQELAYFGKPLLNEGVKEEQEQEL